MKKETITAAPLTDFYLNLFEDGTISLKAYEARNEDCYISGMYLVDGREYRVGKIDDACFFGRLGLRNVSIPEGVTFVADNAFNSCSVEIIYFPSTLNDMTGVFKYLHGHVDIYYAGTEDQWSLIEGTADTPENISIHYEVPVIDVLDEKEYSSQELTLEKTDAEERKSMFGNAVKGMVSGMLSEFFKAE